MLVSKGVNWKAEGTSTRERKTNVNWRFANEDWHSLRRPAPFGDSDLIEFASCRGLLSVIQISKEVGFLLVYVTGHFLLRRQNVWSFIKRILLQNGLYKKDNKLKYTQYSEKGSNMLSLSNWWPAPKGEIIGFEGCGNPLPPRGDIEEMVSGRRR